jgi:hypothetical protein
VKITKRQLRRIIKEEKRKILKEAPRYANPDAQHWAAQSGQELYVNLTDQQMDALNNLENAVDRCIAARCTDADMKDTLESRTMS